MTKKGITEGNKLIMGFIGKLDWAVASLKYHSSWDWLMPVVIKCRESYLRSNAVDTGLKLFHGNTELGEPINKVWIAVVEFIKWKNGTKK